MKKKPEPKPEPNKPRPGDGVPTLKEFGKFVGKLLNVPKSEIDKKVTRDR